MKDLRARLRLDSLLPVGTSWIIWGLVFNGLTTYGYLVVARRALGDGGYGGLAVLWALVNIGGFGLFQPLEQEVARATADRASRGVGSAPVLRRAGVLGAAQFVLVAAGLLAAWPLGLDGLLDHRPELLGVLVLALAAFAGTQLVRGILGGRHLFDRYGWFFVVEGGVRMAVAVVLAVVGVAAVGAYGLAIAVALVAAAAAAVGLRRPFVNPGPPASYRELTPALGFLLIASIGEAFILNVGPVALDVVAGDELGAEAPGVFLNGMLVARIPLFFFQAVKASLLPSLATLAGRGDLVGFRDMQLKIVAAVSAVAVATDSGRRSARAARGAHRLRRRTGSHRHGAAGRQRRRPDADAVTGAGSCRAGSHPACGGGMDRRHRRLRGSGQLRLGAVPAGGDGAGGGGSGRLAGGGRAAAPGVRSPQAGGVSQDPDATGSSGRSAARLRSLMQPALPVRS